VYTPSKNSWSEIASAPVGISACGGVSYKGKIYIFGGDPNKGYDNAGNKTVYAYDPSADTWTLVNSDMPYGRMHIGAALTGDKVYLSPGRPGSSEKLKYMNDNKIQEFDFTKMDQGSKAWRVMNNMPSPQRTGLVGCWPVINGKLYYIGGESDFGEYKYDDVTEFTPDANGGTFRKVTSYPHKLSGIGPIAVGNKIYVAGGGTKSVRLAELWVLAIGDEVAVDYSIRKANSACNARNAFRLRMPMLNGLDFAPLSQGITASGRAMPSSATRLIQPAILLQRQE